MKNADTLEKRMDVLLKTQDIMYSESLYNIEFFAFLNGFLHLKLKNLNDKIKQALELWAIGQITLENTNEEFFKE
jgi:hypothetical protein